MKVGDRVAWTGWFSFGTVSKRVTGTVLKTGLGVPRAYEMRDGELREVFPRLPAVVVEADGHVRHVHELDIVIAEQDLELL